MSFWRDVLTGPDNQTVAFGRLIGILIAVILLLVLPVTAAATVLTGLVKVETWAALMAALQVYVPLIVAAIGGLVWGTNPTEPRINGFEHIPKTTEEDKA